MDNWYIIGFIFEVSLDIARVLSDCGYWITKKFVVLVWGFILLWFFFWGLVWFELVWILVLWSVLGLLLRIFILRRFEFNLFSQVYIAITNQHPTQPSIKWAKIILDPMIILRLKMKVIKDSHNSLCPSGSNRHRPCFPSKEDLHMRQIMPLILLLRIILIIGRSVKYQISRLQLLKG